MRKRVLPKRRRSSKPCQFCVANKEPNYKDGESLKVGLSGKMRIVGRGFTGICQKHQRRLAREIKRARHLALLPFVQQV